MDKEELNKFVGMKIKEFRKRKNLTQNELGARLGLGNTTISSYERGVISSDSDSLYALAHHLDVKVDDFFPPMQTDSLHLVEGKGKNMSSDDMYFFKQLVEKTASMNDDERKKFMESIKFTVDYYNKMND